MNNWIFLFDFFTCCYNLKVSPHVCTSIFYFSCIIHTAYVSSLGLYNLPQTTVNYSVDFSSETLNLFWWTFPIWFFTCCFNLKVSSTGPRSAVGNVSGNRCESDCRSRGREFDPRLVPYFRGDWSWNNFYGHSPPFSWSFKKGCCQLQAKVCARSTG